MKAFLHALLLKLLRKLQPKPDPLPAALAQLRVYREILGNMPVQERAGFVRFSTVAQEMIEARLMGGSGPMFASPSPSMVEAADNAVRRVHDRALGIKIQEGGTTLSSQGAFGDIELALQNVDWRREINLSWLEFSRWGIQQIILISRLYYIKNPLLRRAIDVCSVYVFGRGVEVTSTDVDANEVLKAFFERNQKTLGPTALLDLERRKYYDGNIFFAFFADEEDSGLVDVRTIDATEIQEVVTDPEDGDVEILFKRIWNFKRFDPVTGQNAIESRTAWYPALGWEPPPEWASLKAIGEHPIIWDTPVLHRLCGAVSKWSMGCPIVYPAIEWAKTSKEYLEACLTLAQSHAQIAWTVMTKGGQNALQAIKNQLATTVNAAPANSLWDTNPTPVDASIFGSGPGTTITPVMSRGKGLDPSEVKEFRNMVGMVVGIPPTWLGDMETANLSTATTLDRPTELGFRAKQVQWEEDFTTIAKFVLEVSGAATKGALREAWRRKARESKTICITEAPKKTLSDGSRVYDEKAKPKDDEIQVRVTFPAIREGDMPALVASIVAAMTLDNKGGQIVGIDEKEGVRMLYEVFGTEDAEELLDEMYPTSGKDKYDPSRTKEPLAAPIGKALPPPGGLPQLPGGQQPNAAPPNGGAPGAAPSGVQDKPQATATESAVKRLLEAAKKIKRRAA